MLKKSVPQVSVIIPAYNAEKYIEECVLSVLSQSYQNLEVIVVNDGSSDSTLSILLNMQKRFPLMAVFSKDNEGVSAARNFGISKAHGKYVLLLDSDDAYLPDSVSLLVETAEQYKAQMVSFNFETLFPDGSMGERPVEYSFPDVKTSTGHKCIEYIYAEHIGYFSWAFMYNRQFLVDSHILYPQGFSLLEDALFLNKILRQCGRVAYVSKPCYRYRITEGSLSKRTSFETVDSAFKSLSEIQRIAYLEGPSVKFDAHIVRLYLYIYILLIDCPASEEKSRLRHSIRKKILETCSMRAYHNLSLSNKFQFILLRIHILDNVHNIKRDIKLFMKKF